MTQVTNTVQQWIIHSKDLRVTNPESIEIQVHWRSDDGKVQASRAAAETVTYRYVVVCRMCLNEKCISNIYAAPVCMFTTYFKCAC